MKSVYLGICLFSLVSWDVVASGDWLEASGSSYISGNIEQDRQRAITNAMSRAMLARGVSVQSSSQLNQRTTVVDQISMQSQGVISQVKILSESRNEDTITVDVQLQFQPQQACADGVGRWHKSLLFTQFRRDIAHQSRLGALHDVDVRLPQELAARSYLNGGALSKFAPNMPSGGGLQWGRSVDNELALRRLAAKHQVQYLVTGSISDLGMLNYSAYSNTTELGYDLRRGDNHIRQWFGKTLRPDIKTRAFAFQLRVFDAVSGDVVWDKLYRTEGLWQQPVAASVGFASALFWSLDYGQKVSSLIDGAVQELSRKLACQPLMVPIKQVLTDDRIYLDVGANSGLKVGDVFQVFRHEFQTTTDADYGESLALPRSAIEPTAVSMTVTQVHPEYSRATLTQPLNRNRRYLGVAW